MDDSAQRSAGIFHKIPGQLGHIPGIGDIHPTPTNFDTGIFHAGNHMSRAIAPGSDKPSQRNESTPFAASHSVKRRPNAPAPPAIR